MRTASWKLPFRVLLWKGSPSASRYRARAVKAPVARAQAARPDRQAALFTGLQRAVVLGNSLDLEGIEKSRGCRCPGPLFLCSPAFRDIENRRLSVSRRIDA